MMNTEFPVTIDYVPGSQLMGGLRLTPEESDELRGVFHRLVTSDGVGMTWHEQSVEDSPFVDLFFEVAPESVDLAAADIKVTVDDINARP